MDTQDPPNQPRYQLTRGLMSLDNEKDALTSHCLDRKEVRHAIWRVHYYLKDWPAGENTGCLFLTFSGPVCADRISNCPLDRVLTY